MSFLKMPTVEYQSTDSELLLKENIPKYSFYLNMKIGVWDH